MNSIKALSEELERYGKLTRYNPKEVFENIGNVPRKIGIIKSGLFRYYYLTEEGKEYTKAFMREGDLLSSYSAMVSGEVSQYAIEAIEISEVVEVSYHKWQNLRSKDDKWDKFLITFLEKGYRMKEKREREFLLLDSESRYRLFLKEFPCFAGRLKQHMIASYLGITPIALSRIRKKMKGD